MKILAVFTNIPNVCLQSAKEKGKEAHLLMERNTKVRGEKQNNANTFDFRSFAEYFHKYYVTKNL